MYSNEPEFLFNLITKRLTKEFNSSRNMEFVMSKVEKSVSKLSNFLLKPLLCSLIALDDCHPVLQQIAKHSYMHGNGFYKIVLTQNESFKLRLHIWQDGFVGDEAPHNHRWWFASHIIVGQLAADFWQYGPSQSGSIESSLYYRQGAANDKASIGTANLYKTRQSILEKGEHYYLSPEVIHSIAKTSDDLTATLIVQSAHCRQYNEIFESRPIKLRRNESTVKELKKALLSLLQKL